METQLARIVGIEGASGHAMVSPPGRAAGRRLQLARHERGSARRKEVEAFVAREYGHHFGASVTEFMPTLVSLDDEAGGLRAAAGYRAAGHGPLFLEVYTNEPIETALGRQTGLEVARASIVEVGSLACSSGRAAMDIVKALVPVLISEGFSWVVFTGADTVRNVFRRLDLRPIALCIANRSVLGERQHDWGSYYEHNPVVMAGRLADGATALAADRGDD